MTKQIVIIGGGIVGLSTALECRVRGFEVTVLEKSAFGGAATGAAAGMLAPFSEIEEDPDDFFVLAMESLRFYPSWVETVRAHTKLEFEYSNSGSLHIVYHEADRLSLESRKRWQGDFNVDARIVEGEELAKLEPALSKNVQAAMYYPEESHVYTPDYVAALEDACKNTGVVLKDKLGSVTVNEWQNTVRLLTESGEQVEADQLVICSGAWAKEMEEVFGLRLPVFPVRGQICAYETPTHPVSHIVFSPQGYFVPKDNGTLVNGASEDLAGFNTDVTQEGIDRLTNWNPNVFPFLEAETPFHEWAGLRPATQDGFPFLGSLRDYPHILFATGHYRNGILLSPITAQIIADRIEQKEDRLALDAFQPERFTR
ncbi:glycine oxidase ThiO [Salsuginibacillus kocurii]|uniref:glycine oxidase ThiO n=1 Tax=Salsuginibacillus kocurii TaxID=427078 RepID=UPI00036C113F|nr:glycine oxidase ThiO [Salsuginibacillus kocurii]